MFWTESFCPSKITYVDAINPKMIVFGGRIGIWNIIRIRLSLVVGVLIMRLVPSRKESQETSLSLK